MTFISNRSSIAALLLALLVSACAFGRVRDHEPISVQAVEALQIGDSAARVTELLGAPTEVVQLGLRSAYRYDYTEKKQTGFVLILVNFYNEDSHQDRVWVFFDEQALLTHVGSTFKADETEFGMPWSGRD